MFHITRKGDYAIRGMIHLAGRPRGEVALLRDIAAESGVPPALLAKIFQHLNKTGLVRSQRGAGGGFQLGRQAKDISLLDIIEAVDGPISMNLCIIERGSCGREPFCSVHPVWIKMQRKFKAELGRISLQKLAGKAAAHGG
jgi:Rrf2 family protein